MIGLDDVVSGYEIDFVSLKLAFLEDFEQMLLRFQGREGVKPTVSYDDVKRCSVTVWQTKTQTCVRAHFQSLDEPRTSGSMVLWFAAAANQVGKSQVCSLAFVECFFRDLRSTRISQAQGKRM